MTDAIAQLLVLIWAALMVAAGVVGRRTEGRFWQVPALNLVCALGALGMAVEDFWMGMRIGYEPRPLAVFGFVYGLAVALAAAWHLWKDPPTRIWQWLAYGFHLLITALVLWFFLFFRLERLW